uniref:Serine/threonine-protein phosphatase 2A 65 kDa regulatory subunit A beta isoform n=1 Tax=Ascaris suum TaxID=6253 RepID=F1KX99_ASCSU
MVAHKGSMMLRMMNIFTRSLVCSPEDQSVIIEDGMAVTVEETSADSLYPIAVLIDELRNDDLQIRLNSIRKLSTIALALGAERSRTELIPFLTDALFDHDEVLLALADQLGDLTPLIGGSAYAHHLLRPLEQLASMEESAVREKAVESLCKVADKHSVAALEEHFIPLLRRLTRGDWFTSRCSACGLYSVVYPRMSRAVKADLWTLYKLLCNDATPMVRRTAASKLGEFAKLVASDVSSDELISLFTFFATDDQDSVRWSSIEPCIAISSLLSETQCQTLIKPLLINLFDDRSWRVRCVITDKFLQIQEALGESVSVAVLLPAFGSLLKDVEPEVRTRAAEKVEQFCAALPATDRETEILTHVLPSVEEISKDPSAHVKTALALNVMGLAPLLGSELTVEHLLPIFLTLLQDEVTEVRLNVISTFDKVHNVIDASQLSQSLIPAIVNLAKDCKWRIRLAVVEFVPLLAAQLGHELFDETILPLYLGWLKDPVFAVREAAVNILKQLTDQFGVDWTVNCIFPTMVDSATHRSYLQRMTPLFCLNELCETIGAKYVIEKVMSIVQLLSGDDIPNVRLNVAKTLLQVGRAIDRNSVKKYVKPLLTKLMNDEDFDVRYFAEETRTALQLTV